MIAGQLAALTASARSGGAPPAGYTTGAVHFDGANTSLVNNALAIANSGFVNFSFWFRQAAVNIGKQIWTVDPVGTFASAMSITAPDGNKFEIDIANAASTESFPVLNTNAVSSNAWHSIIFACSVDFAGSPKTGKIYIDNVDVTDAVGGPVAAFQFDQNGLPFFIGDDTFGNGATMDTADFWFDTGTSLLTAGDILAATRAKFIDQATLKPVDLGADGSTPTGTAPAIFLRRAASAAASTFATNLGTGGDFSITGTLTNASTSPSD